MKVVIINGSPRKEGNTSFAIDEMLRVFKDEKVDYEVYQIGNKNIRGCVACNSCAGTGRCVYNDVVNEIAADFEDADGLIVATPVYYANANATLIACLDRLFYSTKFDKTMKVGASVVCARRGGLSATYDQLNKYFSISSMPIVSSNYWNSIHGRIPGEALNDPEGLQTMRLLAKNMVFLMRSIELGKKEYGLPKKEQKIFTHFVR
ncbi:MAG: flavodoxin family protein [Ruminococcaceae bacterium]|nr:flavodoxin family protein [Oscillospiraceae bacterium]